MTTKLIPIPTADLDALRQIRSVIADAVGHPAREAAIAAIDRMAADDGKHSCQCPECCKEKFAEAAKAWTGLGGASQWYPPGGPPVSAGGPMIPALQLGHMENAPAHGLTVVNAPPGRPTRIALDHETALRFEELGYTGPGFAARGLGCTCRYFHNERSPDGVLEAQHDAGCMLRDWRIRARSGELQVIAQNGSVIPAEEYTRTVYGADIAESWRERRWLPSPRPAVTVSCEPRCAAPMCAGHVRTGTATACEAGRHWFRSESTSATVNVANDQRCLCGATTYGEAGQFEER